MKEKEKEFEIVELQEIIKEKDRTIEKLKKVIDEIRSLTYEN